MAVTETISKLMDKLIEGFYPQEREDDDPFGAIRDEENYVEDGNAIKKVEPMYQSTEIKKDSKVIDIGRNHASAYEVMVMEPRGFEDAATIVKYLKERKTIVLNLGLLDNEQSQRTIDFICGAANALNGKPQKVGDKVFIFTPHNVTLSVEVKDVQSKFDGARWGFPTGLEQ